MTDLPVFELSAYGLLAVAGVLFTAYIWRRRVGEDSRLAVVYVGALAGAVLGAKLGFLMAELPFYAGHPDFWTQAWVGRTVLGALLGGYAGVEVSKLLVGYARPTGDLFAVVVPVGLALGRVGCLLHGCCAGRVCEPAWFTVAGVDGLDRWPAQLVELAFQILAAGALGWLWRRDVPRLRGQLFHVYLVAYGAFRFLHEPLRDTPRIGFLTTYQLLALAVVFLGAWRFQTRAGDLARDPAVPA